MQLVTEPSLVGLNLFAIRIGAELFVAAPSRIRVGAQTLAAERVHPVSQLAAGGMRLDRFAILCSTQNYVAQLNGSRDNYLKRYKNKLTVFELRNIVIWVPTDY